MKYMGVNELRESFLSFFESKGHLRLKSFPLIPVNDPSLLLINSGMAPLKDYFTGAQEPPRRRVATCQKCIRTPDIERVGKTARHGTYFEMLGNFSFGDYFKKEAIEWAWEFCTGVLEIPKEKIWVSVFEEDDESRLIWEETVGIPGERIVKLGRADNFWEHGSGPCGPCSEIYFDRGEAYGCGDPDCKPGCDCDRFMEIWNNVFSQFNSDGKGSYTELKTKNIDTGMGLERLACVMQGVDNLFEVDTVRKILDHVCALSGTKYGADRQRDVSIRVITDHIRSTVFLICDGVMPSNEGRGYVLRRLLRRALRHGRLLNISGSFLSALCDTVIAENRSAYPELAEKADYIKKILTLEEDKFQATIDSGLSILNTMIAQTLAAGKKRLSGEDCFKLNDTYGFPIDLTREIAAEQGLALDEDTFRLLMEEQKTRARQARGQIGGWDKQNGSLTAGLPDTVFLGYSDYDCETRLLFLLQEEQAVDSVSDGEFTAVLDQTCFYAESGGQVGDTGLLTADGVRVRVLDTQKTTDGIYLHLCRLEEGVLRKGDTVFAAVDRERRMAIMRNHSAAHLLQAALRKVVGSHVEQAGSHVDENRLRFDFRHFAALTGEELAAVEEEVNRSILGGHEIRTELTDPESAKKAGATALFGEKYGKVVRMVIMDGVSVELCGGTHLDNTAKAGLFTIVSESSVAAGIRRIEAVTGLGVLKRLYGETELLRETALCLKANDTVSVPARAQQLQDEVRELKKQIESLKAKQADSLLSTLEAQMVRSGSLRLLFAKLDGGAEELSAVGDALKQGYADLAAVLYHISEDGKILFVCVCGRDAVASGAHAGNILKKISPIVGGGGGGRPDRAASGGRDASRLPDAKEAFFTMLS